MDCMLREGSDVSADVSVPLTERIRLIDDTVEEFSAHLRNVLVRCIKPDLTWNREYGVEGWSDSRDVVAAAYAPGVWYALRGRMNRRGLPPSGDSPVIAGDYRAGHLAARARQVVWTPSQVEYRASARAFDR